MIYNNNRSGINPTDYCYYKYLIFTYFSIINVTSSILRIAVEPV